MKLSVLLLIALVSVQSVVTYARTCEETLIAKLEKDRNLNIVQITNTYSCAGGAACAVSFEHDEKPYKNVNVLAYLDMENEINISWAPFGSKDISGWEVQGKYYCTDIRDYLHGKFSSEKVLQLEISKETARDAMFCPTRKVFSSYKTLCISNSN
jgi:hypothetical protein